MRNLQDLGCCTLHCGPISQPSTGPRIPGSQTSSNCRLHPSRATALRLHKALREPQVPLAASDHLLAASSMGFWFIEMNSLIPFIWPLQLELVTSTTKFWSKWIQLGWIKTCKRFGEIHHQQLFWSSPRWVLTHSHRSYRSNARPGAGRDWLAGPCGCRIAPLVGGPSWASEGSLKPGWTRKRQGP